MTREAEKEIAETEEGHRTEIVGRRGEVGIGQNGGRDSSVKRQKVSGTYIPL